MLLVKQWRVHERFPDGAHVMLPMRFGEEDVFILKRLNEVVFSVPDPPAGEWPVLRMSVEEYVLMCKRAGCKALAGMMR